VIGTPKKPTKTKEKNGGGVGALFGQIDLRVGNERTSEIGGASFEKVAEVSNYRPLVSREGPKRLGKLKWPARGGESSGSPKGRGVPVLTGLWVGEEKRLKENRTYILRLLGVWGLVHKPFGGPTQDNALAGGQGTSHKQKIQFNQKENRP